MLGDRLLPALVGVDRLGVGPQLAGPRTSGSPRRFPGALVGGTSRAHARRRPGTRSPTDCGGPSAGRWSVTEFAGTDRRHPVPGRRQPGPDHPRLPVADPRCGGSALGRRRARRRWRRCRHRRPLEDESGRRSSRRPAPGRRPRGTRCRAHRRPGRHPRRPARHPRRRRQPLHAMRTGERLRDRNCVAVAEAEPPLRPSKSSKTHQRAQIGSFRHRNRGVRSRDPDHVGPDQRAHPGPGPRRRASMGSTYPMRRRIPTVNVAVDGQRGGGDSKHLAARRAPFR